MNKKIMLETLRNTAGAALYIFLVSQLMENGSKLFGEDDGTFGPFVVLLLFSLSAAVVGGLILGPSVILFAENKKSESIKSAIYSVGWLALYTLLGFVTLMIV